MKDVDTLPFPSHVREKLLKLKLRNAQDILLHMPLRYVDETHLTPIQDIRMGDYVQIEGEIIHNEIMFKPRKALIIQVADGTSEIFLRFLHFYPNQTKMLAVGKKVRIVGEARQGHYGLEMIHPQITPVTEHTSLKETLTPIYSTVAGLSQVQWHKIIDWALKNVDMTETLPSWVYPDAMPNFATSIRYLHRPPATANLALLEDRTQAMWQRLALDELLAQQLLLRRYTAKRKVNSAYACHTSQNYVPSLLRSLGFELTSAQKRVFAEIEQDLQQSYPMHRLLQGDVGSGKTVIAVLSALTVIDAGYQVAFMAPTEILAEQHFKKVNQYLCPLGINIAYLSGSQNKTERQKNSFDIANNVAKLVIGTHALFQEGIDFHSLALVIIDEQHRFGVAQRLKLRQKGQDTNLIEPHQLMMSATPIPRTLSMSYFADLEVSTMDELPVGRIPVITKLIDSHRRVEILHRVYQECQAGKQAYWVCPLIDESEVLPLQTVLETLSEFQTHYPDLKVGLAHGKLKAKEKQEVMEKFRQGELQLLIATTVIEVGVDVANANLMVIEHAERMGLSQLHQLRGRIGRSSAQGTCILLYQKPLSETARERLKIIYENQDGFEIASADLNLRGPGEFLGTRQSGVPLLKIADIRRDEMLVSRTRQIAHRLLRECPEEIERHIERWVHYHEELGKV